MSSRSAEIVPSSQWQAEARTQRFRTERGQPLRRCGRKGRYSSRFFHRINPARSDTSIGGPAIAAILVHLDQFRVLILPNVTEAILTALKCDHADVVYCGRLRSRRFPRSLMIAKLSPSILVLNGTKPEVMANSQDNPLESKMLLS